MAMPKSPALPPDLSTQHGRLRWARERYVSPMGETLGSPRAAANRFGWNENTYKSYENGERGKKGIPIEAVKTYAKTFKVNAAWILTGQGSPLGKDELDDLTPEERAKALRLYKAAS